MLGDLLGRVERRWFAFSARERSTCRECRSPLPDSRPFEQRFCDAECAEKNRLGNLW